MWAVEHIVSKCCVSGSALHKAFPHREQEESLSGGQLVVVVMTAVAVVAAKNIVRSRSKKQAWHRAENASSGDSNAHNRSEHV